MRAASWFVDYLHLLRGNATMFLHRNPPEHYLSYTISGKQPIILLPGITLKWAFMKKLGDQISLSGHPVYVVPKLGYNLSDIPTSAKIVRELIGENSLRKVIIIGHSKGGLIGKYLLCYDNDDRRISGLIAIATPFSGSKAGHLVPHKAFWELTPKSNIIEDLKLHGETNKKIISILPIFDNHIWAQEGSWLEGAENVRVNVSGHHKVLFSKEVAEKVFEAIQKLSS